jgi:hypothetical protein
MPITIIFSIFVPGCETLFFTEAREKEYLDVFEEVQRRVRACCFGRRVLRWGEGNYLAATLLKLNSISFDKYLWWNSLIDVEEILL